MKSNQVTFNETFEGFKNYLSEKHRSVNTVKSYIQDLNYFEKWLCTKYLNTIMVQQITKTDIKDFERDIKANLNLSPATINRRLISIKKWSEYIVQSQYTPVNLGEEISIKKVQKQNNIRWLTRQEVGKLLHAVELTKHQNYKKGLLHETLIILLVNLGLRVEEACLLKTNNVKFHNNLISINGKGDKHRIIPLTERTRAQIQSWIVARDVDSEYILTSSKSDRLSTRAAQHILKKYSNLLGIEITPHSLRHTYCKQLANSGVGLETIAELAGHNSVDTTRIYVTPSIRELQSALKKTEF